MAPVGLMSFLSSMGEKSGPVTAPCLCARKHSTHFCGETWRTFETLKTHRILCSVLGSDRATVGIWGTRRVSEESLAYGWLQVPITSGPHTSRHSLFQPWGCQGAEVSGGDPVPGTGHTSWVYSWVRVPTSGHDILRATPE